MKYFKEFQFSIDRGGTFTDIYCNIYQPIASEESNAICREEVSLKLLSEAPLLYSDAALEGIRQIIIDQVKKDPWIKPSLSQKSDSNQVKFPSCYHISSIRLGTTIATNALLEEKGASTLLLVTKGFKDILIIGNQTRPNIFELNIGPQPIYYDYIEEIEERIIINHNESFQKEGYP